jgi:rod shape-determining protein MreB
MGRDLAIDLGTANTLIYRQSDGIVLNEPTVVAMKADSGNVVAIGADAWRAVSRDSGTLTAVRPLREGVMVEFEMTAAMLELAFRKVGMSRFPRPKVLVSVSSAASAVERRAIEEAVAAAGGRGVTLVEEPLAAAIGAGLPIHEPMGNLVVDIGGGTSEMAVVSMGGVVSGGATKLGGFDIDAAIVRHVGSRYGVTIGERAAEGIKIAVGSAFPSPSRSVAVVTGRQLSSGNMVEVKLRDDEVRKAISEVVGEIVSGARRTLAEAPPELTHDVLETGMFLTGGGSLLRGLDMLLAQECEVPVHVTEKPLQTVAIGAGRMLEHLDDYRTAFQLTREPTGRTR